jgi:hypothetical protein
MSEMHPQSSGQDATSAVDQVAQLLVGDAPVEEVTDEVTYPDTDEGVGEEVEQSEVELQDSEDVEYETEESHEDEDQDDEDGLVALASELGLDEDKLTLSEDGDIMVKLKVNGKDEQVNLKEAIAGTQYNKANEEKARVLAEERKSFESEREQVAGAFKQQMQHIQGLGQMLEQKLMAEYQNLDWDRLRLTDPAEWAAKQTEFQQRQAELQQAGSMLGQQMQEQQAAEDKQLQEQRAQVLQQERSVMLEAIPEWSDEERMKGDLEAITSYARSMGFPDEELSDVVYNRHLQVLRKAMLYDQGKTVAEKKVKKAPKMQRSANGRFVSKKQNKVNKLVERAKNAKGANKREAQADAVAAILMGE